MFLPWFVGNVVDSPTGEHYYGFVSTWGIFYDGKMHNAHEVFASGFWDIVTFLVSYTCRFRFSYLEITSCWDLRVFLVADIVILLLLFRTTLELKFSSTMCFSFQFYIFGSDWVHFGTSGGCTYINIAFVWLDGRLSLACFYVSAHFYSFLFIFHLLQKFCITTTTNCNDMLQEVIRLYF